MDQQWGILILLLVAIAVVATKAGIYYLLAVFIPLFPSFRIRAFGNNPIYFIDILLLIGLLKYLLSAYGDESPQKKNRYSPWLMLILISGMVSYLVGIALGNPLQSSTYCLFRTLLPLTGFLWAYRLFSVDRALIGKTVSIFIASSTLMALLGMGVLFKVDPVVRLTTALAPLSDSLNSLLTLATAGGRLAFDMYPATATGGFFLVPIFAIACLIAVKAKSSSRNTALLFIALTIDAIALILTFTRSAIAGFIFGLIIFVLLSARKPGNTVRQRGGKLALVVVSILALAVGIFVIARAIEKRDPIAQKYEVQFGLQGEAVQYSRESRVDSVISSFSNMAKDPLPAVFGSGMGTLMIGEQTSIEGTDLAYKKYYGHNFFLVELMYWGLLGFGVFLLLIISLWINLKQFSSIGIVKDPIDIALMYSLLCILPVLLLTFFVETAYARTPPLNTLLWFLLGAGSWIATHYREEISTVTAGRSK